MIDIEDRMDAETLVTEWEAKYIGLPESRKDLVEAIASALSHAYKRGFGDALEDEWS
jgi:hypothetical protein